MKKTNLLILSVFISINLYSQRNNPLTKSKGSLKTGFEYSEIGDFSDAGHFIIDITPVRSMVYGNYQNVGSGLGLSVMLNNKISFDADFAYNFYSYAWLDYRETYGLEKYKKNSSIEFGSNLGYTISNKKVTKDAYTTLKVESNTIYYAMLPATVSKSIIAQVGFKSLGMFNSSEPTFTTYSYDSMYDTTYVILSPKKVKNFFQNKSLYLGLKYTEIVDTRYKTDIYGEVSATRLNEIYGGLLLGLKPAFNTISHYNTDDPYYPNEITSVVPILPSSQAELNSQYNFLPLGFKLGMMNSDKRSVLSLWLGVCNVSRILQKCTSAIIIKSKHYIQNCKKQ